MLRIKSQKLFSLAAIAAVVGTVVSPVIASAATDTSTVTATVNSVISVSSTDTAAITVTPDANGEIGTATDTVTVNSNDAEGYDLTIAASDASNSLTGSNGGSLAAASGTYASPASLAVNTWGYRVSTFAANSYAGVPVTGSAQNLASPVDPSATNGDDLVITYAANIDTHVPTGVFSDIVTYTATVK